MAETVLTDPQRRVMLVLGIAVSPRDGTCASEIASRANLGRPDKQHKTQALARIGHTVLAALEAKGLVWRGSQDRGARNGWHLTANGRRLLAALSAEPEVTPRGREVVDG